MCRLRDRLAHGEESTSGVISVDQPLVYFVGIVERHVEELECQLRGPLVMRTKRRVRQICGLLYGSSLVFFGWSCSPKSCNFRHPTVAPHYELRENCNWSPERGRAKLSKAALDAIKDRILANHCKDTGSSSKSGRKCSTVPEILLTKMWR